MAQLTVPSLANFVRGRRTRSTVEWPRGRSRQQLAHSIHSSIGYLAKIEQGEATNPSPSILEPLAATFDLTADERVHMYRLARQHISVRTSGPPGAAGISRQVLMTLDALTPHPAAAIDRLWNVLAWNEAFEAACPGLSSNGNILNWMFYDPRSRLVLEDWEREADFCVGLFHGQSAWIPDRVNVEQLLKELGEQHDFHRLWSAGNVYLRRLDPTVQLRDPHTGESDPVYLQHYRVDRVEPVWQLIVGLRAYSGHQRAFHRPHP